MTNKSAPRALQLAPATLASDSLTLVWDKPIEHDRLKQYEVYQDDELVGTRDISITHYSFANLEAERKYKYTVTAVTDSGERISTEPLYLTTLKAGHVIDVTAAPYHADGKGEKLSTQAIQMAINDAAPGDTVLIPAGQTILSGAIDLKSDLTLQVDGVLKGSMHPEDYLISAEDGTNFPGKYNQDGLILTRYEGWEMYCYRSLINAGYLTPDDRHRVTCENIRICGKGTILGGGNVLGVAMRENYADAAKYPEYVSDNIPGRRVRGRLLSFIQCRNVHLTGVNVVNPPCWTIHMIYCDTVTTNHVNIESQGVDNGDGWDPDSSRNMMIFDTTFDTGDDCIAIKSGKNPEGNRINIPTENVRIFDLNMIGGHGMAIGSEQSGGVRNVSLHDCTIQHTLYGLELKANPSRGGYIKHLEMRDCTIDSFTAQSVPYNADGEAAPEMPYFEDILLENVDIKGANEAVKLKGFINLRDKADTDHYIANVTLRNVKIHNGINHVIKLKACKDLNFKNVKLADGSDPKYDIDQRTVLNLRVED